MRAAASLGAGPVTAFFRVMLVVKGRHVRPKVVRRARLLCEDLISAQITFQ